MKVVSIFALALLAYALYWTQFENLYSMFDASKNTNDIAKYAFCAGLSIICGQIVAALINKVFSFFGYELFDEINLFSVADCYKRLETFGGTPPPVRSIKSSKVETEIHGQQKN